MTYGYARVSSVGQQIYGNSLSAQEEQLRDNGAEVVFRETYTGTKLNRPKLDELMRVLKEGDTLIVCKLDRIARSTRDGLAIIDELLEKGVEINILNMGRFDASPSGKLMRTIFLAFAEFERDMIVTRTREGKEIARQDPNYREGRKPKEYDESLFDSLYEDVMDGALSVTDAAETLGVSRAKWYRIVKERKAAA